MQLEWKQVLVGNEYGWNENKCLVNMGWAGMALLSFLAPMEFNDI